MRVVSAFLVAVSAAAWVGGCTPYIPVRDAFGTSGLAPVGDIPPEFAEFNAYNPAINPQLAEQLCATPYQPLAEQTVAATPGVLVEVSGRCQFHVPIFGQ